MVVAAKILLFTDPPYVQEPDSYKKIGLREGAVVKVSGAHQKVPGQQKDMWAMRHRQQRAAAG